MAKECAFTQYCKSHCICTAIITRVCTTIEEGHGDGRGVAESTCVRHA